MWSFGATGPWVHRHQAVTIHDATVFAVPESFGRRFRAWYQLSVHLMLRKNPVTMTVSEFSAGELARVTGVSREKIRVSGAGWEHVRRVPPEPEIIAELGLESDQYLLAVGSRSHHKNLAVVARALRIVEAERRPSIQLVVAGGSDSRVFGEEGSPPPKGLLHAGYVSDGALRALYENAAAFIFPSRYEGFGLPPLEAMALGCPVICARAASMPEVCGDGVLYFDPDHPEELARTMTEVTQSAKVRASLRQRAPEVLARHSWRSAAEAHLELVASHFQPRHPAMVGG